MNLIATPSNPIPHDPSVTTIVAKDGVRLRVAYWRAGGGERRGTICLFHGRAECIEKYFELVGELRDRGFAVVSFDWRGQGGSDRRLTDPRKGHVDDFSEYDLDLDAVMTQVVLPDCPAPFFAVAHSMGALLCLRAARLGRTRFHRMVLTSPMLDFSRKTPRRRWAQLAARLATATGFADLRLPGRENLAPDRLPFVGNRNTSDPIRYQRFADILREAPQLAVGAATFGWLAAAFRAMREAASPDFAPAIQVPVLLLTAGQDEVVSNAATGRFSRELRAGAELEIAGSRHEIMMERDSLRELFWAAFDAFIPGSALTAETSAYGRGL